MVPIVALPERTQRLVDQRSTLLRERAAPLLEPGEDIQAIFPAQVGLNPGGSIFSGAFSVLNRKIIIAATDRAVVILDARRRYQPTRVASRSPRSTRLGPATTSPMARAFRKLSLPEPTWISSIWRYAVDEADALAPPPDDPDA
jgi:hypothetical protein